MEMQNVLFPFLWLFYVEIRETKELFSYSVFWSENQRLGVFLAIVLEVEQAVRLWDTPGVPEMPVLEGHEARSSSQTNWLLSPSAW